MGGLGELEAAAMDVVWAAPEPVTVREVLTALTRGRRQLAYTTVMTVMNNLVGKGWLERTPVGRAFTYQPTLTRADYTAQLMSRALADSRDRTASLLRFVETLPADELRALRSAVSRASRRTGP